MRGLAQIHFRNNYRFYLGFLIALFLTTSLAGCGWFGFAKKTTDLLMSWLRKPIRK